MKEKDGELLAKLADDDGNEQLARNQKANEAQENLDADDAGQNAGLGGDINVQEIQAENQLRQQALAEQAGAQSAAAAIPAQSKLSQLTTDVQTQNSSNGQDGLLKDLLKDELLGCNVPSGCSPDELVALYFERKVSKA